MNLKESAKNLLSNNEKHPMEFLSLFFTLFYFFPLYFIGADTALVIKIFVMYFVLLGMLFGCAIASPKYTVAIALLLVVSSSFGVKYYIGTNCFFGFAIFYMAFNLRFLHAVLAVVFSLVCAYVAALKFNALHAYFIVPLLIPSLVLFIAGTFERQKRAHRKQEQLSQEQIEKLATVAERERIARDLHDVLGHTLSSIALKAQLAEKLFHADDLEKARKEISEVSTIASEALFEVRQAISGYKLKTIEQRMVQLAERLSEKGVAMEQDCEFSALAPKAESAISLLLTEAITNILRHSDCSKVKVSSKVENKLFKLSVCDDGNAGKIVIGNGLSGIKERVEDLGGTFRFSSSDGFCLYVELGAEQFK